MTIVRWALTLFFVFKSFQETGVWTSSSLFFIFLSIEILNFTYRTFSEQLHLDRKISEWEKRYVTRK